MTYAVNLNTQNGLQPFYQITMPDGAVDLNGNSIAGKFAYIPACLLLGADGVNPVSSSNPLPTSGNSSPLPAGSNLIGKVGIDQTTPGTTNATYDTSFAVHAPAYFQATVTTAAQTLAALIGTSIPAWATMAFVTVEGSGSIRYRADGTAPTGAIGQPVAQGQSWPLQGASALSAAQLIAVAASTIVSIEFRG